MDASREIEEIREVLIDLQAEISALKNLMFENNPALGAEFQRRVDDLRTRMQKSRRENLL